MSYFFSDLEPAEEGVVPVAPEEMKILDLRVERVAADGPARVRVYIDVTAFQQRPWLEVVMTDSAGEEVASANIIEPIMRKNVFTLHIRRNPAAGAYTLRARLFYPEQADCDARDIQFTIDD
jgi:hypothetical protein